MFIRQSCVCVFSYGSCRDSIEGVSELVVRFVICVLSSIYRTCVCMRS